MNPKGQKWISLNLNKIQAQKYIKFLKGNQVEYGGPINALPRGTAPRIHTNEHKVQPTANRHLYHRLEDPFPVPFDPFRLGVVLRCRDAWKRRLLLCIPPSAMKKGATVAGHALIFQNSTATGGIRFFSHPPGAIAHGRCSPKGQKRDASYRRLPAFGLCFF